MQTQVNIMLADPPEIEERKLVTMRVDGQLLGVPVSHVCDVLRGGRIARIPLAAPEISGSMNLRGRIVTVIDMRIRLGLAPPDGDAAPMFVVAEHKGELFSLKVDSIGDVLTIPVTRIEKSPSNLAAAWRDVSSGVYRRPDELLMIIDVAALLAPGSGKGGA